jgi:hypothetical protein
VDLDGKGIELDPKDFDGDWDHVYARTGTQTHVIITKYRCLKQGCLLPSSEWVVESHYDKQWGIKLYREEKLNKLGI